MEQLKQFFALYPSIAEGNYLHWALWVTFRQSQRPALVTVEPENDDLENVSLGMMNGFGERIKVVCRPSLDNPSEFMSVAYDAGSSVPHTWMIFDLQGNKLQSGLFSKGEPPPCKMS